jgi:predicted enzyme related to lactoylglutathione lyase
MATNQAIPNLPFKVEGITWHAVTLDASAFQSMNDMMRQVFGVAPMMELDGVTVFAMPNGTLLELYQPQTVPPYGYNNAIAFGFRVDDIEAASRALAQAGYELLGEITRVEEMKYAYRHFRAKDGRVYGLNEQK